MADGEGGSDLLDFAGEVGAGNMDTPTVMPTGLTDPGVGNMDTGTNFSPSWMGGGGDGGGFGKFASDLGAGLGREITGSPLKAFSTALGLGSTGMNLMNQSRLSDQMKSNERSIKDSQQRASAAAAPAVAAGTADINRSQAGKLQPAVETRLTEWARKRKADARARFASMGLGNSTDIDAIDRQIDNEVDGIRGQLLGQQEQVGGQLLGVGVNANQASGQMGQQQQKMLMDLIAAADAQIGKIAGSSA